MIRSVPSTRRTGLEKRLRIECDKGSSWIEILHRGDAHRAAFEVGCGVDLGHGNFFARNSDIRFQNAHAFATELDHFIMDRTLTPQLKGTCGTFLILWQPGMRDEVMLSFAIGGVNDNGPLNLEFTLTGSFALPQSGLVSFVNGFRKLLSVYEPEAQASAPPS